MTMQKVRESRRNGNVLINCYIEGYIYKELEVLQRVKAVFETNKVSMSDIVRSCLNAGIAGVKRSLGIEEDPFEILSSKRAPRWTLEERYQKELELILTARNTIKNQRLMVREFLEFWIATNDEPWIKIQTGMLNLCREVGIKVKVAK